MPSQLFGVTDLNPSQEHFVSIRMQSCRPGNQLTNQSPHDAMGRLHVHMHNVHK